MYKKKGITFQGGMHNFIIQSSLLQLSGAIP